ncbi:MAG TPA: hypothetical protein ENL04_03755, partial [Sulfuricurvum sp.]|nr:hypothetical protein [Sulfuricurvum sp.]
MQKYDRMVITQQTEEGSKKMVRFGQIYEASYRLSAPHDFEHYTHRLKANLLKRAGYQKNIADRQRFFQLARTPEQWISITVFRDHYVVRYFRQSSYPDTVSFDTSRPYTYSERLKKLGWTVPPNTYIPHIRAFEIEKALYARKGEYQFTTQESNHSVEGEVWKIKYAWRGQKRDEVRRYAILHQFRDMVTLRGAEILFEDATHIVFRTVRNGENIWGVFGGNDFSVSLVLVQASS